MKAGREDLIGNGPKCLIRSKEQRYMDVHGLGYKGKSKGKSKDNSGRGSKNSKNYKDSKNSKNKKSNDTRDNRNPRDSRDTKAPKKSRGSFKERQAAKNRRSR